MTKKAHFYIDDVIWVMRDLAAKKPNSIFDLPFLAMLKTAHEKYGVKTQLNLFFQTSYFYGNEDFSPKDVPDSYRAEWENASEWLKLSFHAKEEFPDYPHVNASYQDMFDLFQMTKREVIRFAGEKSFTYCVCPHWNAVSKEGVKALFDCGVRVIDVSCGDAKEYSGDPNSLPYGHAMRLLNNRKPETRVYQRGGPNVAINHSLCAYNHLSLAQLDEIRGTLKGIRDEKTGMLFKKFHLPEMTLNLMEYSKMEEVFAPFIGREFVGVGTHEQYFYEDYFAYQPDYGKMVLKTGEILSKSGYEFIFAEEFAEESCNK